MCNADCENEGTCDTDVNGNMKCICLERFYGNRCQNSMELSYCLNFIAGTTCRQYCKQNHFAEFELNLKKILNNFEYLKNL